MIYLKEIRLDETSIEDRNVYPLNIPALKNFKELEFKTPVTFLVGENGVGKSTLIEAIAVAMNFNPEGGTINYQFSTVNSHSNLFKHLITVRGAKRNKDGFFLRAESFYNDISYLESLGPDAFKSYGGESLHESSHGEGFMKLLINRCRGNSFFIFDEPEAALSPASQIKMLSRMHQLVDEGSQFIISTHSPILLAYPGETIYMLSNDGISQTIYEATEHYMLMKYFLNNTEKFLSDLGF